MAISIHAPTRGATITIFANFIFHIISIHAPTRGATGGVLYVNCVTRYFNPRSHKGSDHKLRTKFFSMPISIHAPTRGATALVRDLQKQSAISIHAPTRGATLVADAVNQAVSISIHAPTRGATIPGHGHLWHTAMISIHAPTRGATHLTELLDPFTVISIHAPTRGATVSYIAARKRFGISIHAPTRGATPMGVQYLPVSADFNPRSHKGSDAQSGTLADGIWSFQSTLPQGERPMC